MFYLSTIILTERLKTYLETDIPKCFTRKSKHKLSHSLHTTSDQNITHLPSVFISTHLPPTSFVSTSLHHHTKTRKPKIITHIFLILSKSSSLNQSSPKKKNRELRRRRRGTGTNHQQQWLFQQSTLHKLSTQLTS